MQNDFKSYQTQGGGQTRIGRAGICAAMTALWCKSMFEGVPPKDTRPHYFRAQLLQVKYRWSELDAGPTYIQLFKTIGVDAEVISKNLDVDIAMWAMSNRPGVYHLNYLPKHTVGACVTGQKFYFFDCDAELGAGGLHEFADSAEWKDLIRKYYGYGERKIDGSVYTRPAAHWLSLKVVASDGVA